VKKLVSISAIFTLVLAGTYIIKYSFIFFKGWGSELSVYKEDGCYKIEQSIHFYCIIFLGIVQIILVFYFHTAHPELYLSEYEENQLWQNVGCSGDTNVV